MLEILIQRMRFAAIDFDLVKHRKADRVIEQRTIFQHIRRWVGTPIGFWDTDLYNQLNRPASVGDFDLIGVPAVAKGDIKAAGIPQEAIQSESQNIGPVQNYGGDQNWTPAEKAQRKFQVQQSWSVKTAAGNGARVLDVAIKAGANQSGQMTWSVQDEDGLQARAAKLALERARQIAQQMAGGLNATLGPLVYASNEAPSRGPQPLMMRAAGAMAAAPQAQKVEPLSVSARKVTTSATVYAVFSIQ